MLCLRVLGNFMPIFLIFVLSKINHARTLISKAQSSDGSGLVVGLCLESMQSDLQRNWQGIISSSSQPGLTKAQKRRKNSLVRRMLLAGFAADDYLGIENK